MNVIVFSASDTFNVSQLSCTGSKESMIFRISDCILSIKRLISPVRAWSGPEGSNKLRFPDYMTTAQDGGKVVSLKYRPLLPPGNTPGTHFC